MKNYGLVGNKYPEDKKNIYCPNSKRSCCAQSDITRTMELWRRDQQQVISAYYETYLESMKYLLGWTEEVNKLAEEFKPSGHKTQVNMDKGLDENTKDGAPKEEVDFFKDQQEIMKLGDLLGHDPKENKLLTGDDACNDASAQIQMMKSNPTLAMTDY